MNLLSLCFQMGVVMGVVRGVFLVQSVVEWELASLRVRRYYNLTAEGQSSSLSLLTLREALGLDPNIDLRESDSLVTAQGTTVVRLVEEFNGDRVRDSRVDISLKPDGTIDRVGGKVTSGLANALRDYKEGACRLTKARFLEIALGYESLDLTDVSVQRNRVAYRYVIREDGTPAYLSFVDVFFTTKSTGNVTRRIYTIEPCSGTIVDVREHTRASLVADLLKLKLRASRRGNGKENRRRDRRGPQRRAAECSPLVVGVGGNEKVGQVNYGTEPNCLHPVNMLDNGTCFLENEFIKVIDLKNGTENDYNKAVDFDCLSGYSDANNGGYSPTTDAFYHATQWALMFREWYSYAPLSNPKPRAFVHFGGQVDNAFWDGENMLLGDGSDDTFPYTVLDIVAHELSHGLTERSSDLELRGESGAVAESFCDAVGEVAEEYVYGNNDWMVGGELMKAAGQAIRYFRDPSSDGVSIDHIGNYTRGMNVHYASGLFNRVFYLVAHKFGIRRAFESFLVANRIYWHETSGFEDAACDVIKGAYDAGLDMLPYIRAFRHIGLTLSSCGNPTEFVLPIQESEKRENLRVSMVTQPIFKILPPEGAKRFAVRVQSEVETKVTVSSSPTRSPLREITSSIDNLSFPLDPNQRRFYIRLSNREAEDKPAIIYVRFRD